MPEMGDSSGEFGVSVMPSRVRQQPRKTKRHQGITDSTDQTDFTESLRDGDASARHEPGRHLLNNLGMR